MRLDEFAVEYNNYYYNYDDNNDNITLFSNGSIVSEMTHYVMSSGT